MARVTEKEMSDVKFLKSISPKGTQAWTRHNGKLRCYKQIEGEWHHYYEDDLIKVWLKSSKNTKWLRENGTILCKKILIKKNDVVLVKNKLLGYDEMIFSHIECNWAVCIDKSGKKFIVNKNDIKI
jgi:hypothetical protein